MTSSFIILFITLILKLTVSDLRMSEQYKMTHVYACLTFYSCNGFILHMIQFLFFTLSVKTRLSKLNELLIESFLNEAKGNDPKRQQEILEGVGMIYDKLVNVCEQIGGIYGVSVIIESFK